MGETDGTKGARETDRTKEVRETDRTKQARETGGTKEARETDGTEVRETDRTEQARETDGTKRAGETEQVRLVLSSKVDNKAIRFSRALCVICHLEPLRDHSISSHLVEACHNSAACLRRSELGCLLARLRWDSWQPFV